MPAGPSRPRRPRPLPAERASRQRPGPMSGKIEVGGVFAETFSLYRRFAGPLLAVAFVFYLVVIGFEALVFALVLKSWLGGTLVMLTGFVYQGPVVELVRADRGGRADYSVRAMLGSVVPVLLPLTLAGLLVTLGTLFGIAFFIVPGLVALTFWAVVAPAIVVERPGVFAAFGRSSDLVGGNAWRVFGVVLVGILLVSGCAYAMLALAESLLDDSWLAAAVSVLVTTIFAPIGALIAAVLYFRLREIEDATPPPPPAPVAAPPSA